MIVSAVKLRYPEKWIQESIEAQQLLVKLHSCRRQLLHQIGIQPESAADQNISGTLVHMDESLARSHELLLEIYSIKKSLERICLAYLMNHKGTKDAYSIKAS